MPQHATRTVKETARWLLSLLAALRHAVGPRRPIVFLGESFEGLIVKQVRCQIKDDRSSSVDELIDIFHSVDKIGLGVREL